MDWVTIDREKCDNCGICILRCMMCFRKENDEVVARVDENCCNLCGHCVALCPEDAILHHRMDTENFEDTGEGQTFDTDEFIRFIRERRSHRLFKKKEIPKDDLAKLVDTCRYAPTGSNVQNLEIIVVQDEEKRKKLSDLTVGFFEELSRRTKEGVEKMKADGREVPEDVQRTLFYGDRLTLARKVGIDPIFYNAPAVMIFHSPVRTSAPKDNCVIASTTMGLLARTMGLEYTYIGLFEAASRGYEPLIKELALPEGHLVFSVIIMGYPKLKFLKTVDRKPVRTRWE